MMPFSQFDSTQLGRMTAAYQAAEAELTRLAIPFDRFDLADLIIVLEQTDAREADASEIANKAMERIRARSQG
jgi:hypothetical protein